MASSDSNPPSGQKSPTPTGTETKPQGTKPTGKKPVKVGDFQVVKLLGKGGMGKVYLAKQISLDRKVALKTLSKDLAERPDFVERFKREARSMARLHHPNILQVYAVDSVNGVHFAAIEFVDGASFQDHMDEKGKLSVGDALHAVLLTAEALAHAHEQNMIHRDIKPDNILVTKKGELKVADFGLAKALDEDVSMTQSGTGLGTPLYMAPEQARNAKHVDQRTDIYALGTTLYYFLTGALPFQGDSTLDLIIAKEKGTFKPAKHYNSEVPERLDLILDKAMAKNPDHRYSTCAEMIKDLESLGLESQGFSFISGGAANARSSRARTPTSVAAPTQRPAHLKTSAEVAAEQEAKKQAPATEHEWFVKYTTPAGKQTIGKMTTSQVIKGIRGGLLDLKSQAKKEVQGQFLPLAQFSEFSDLMEKKAVAAKAESKSEGLSKMYEKLDKQDKRRKKFRWLRNLKDGALGWVGLLIYLAIAAAVLYGLYRLVIWGFPLIAEGAGVGGGS